MCRFVASPGARVKITGAPAVRECAAHDVWASRLPGTSSVTLRRPHVHNTTSPGVLSSLHISQAMLFASNESCWPVLIWDNTINQHLWCAIIRNFNCFLSANFHSWHLRKPETFPYENFTISLHLQNISGASAKHLEASTKNLKPLKAGSKLQVAKDISKHLTLKGEDKMSDSIKCFWVRTLNSYSSKVLQIDTTESYYTTV